MGDPGKGVGIPRPAVGAGVGERLETSMTPPHVVVPKQPSRSVYVWQALRAGVV